MPLTDKQKQTLFKTIISHIQNQQSDDAIDFIRIYHTNAGDLDAHDDSDKTLLDYAREYSLKEVRDEILNLQNPSLKDPHTPIQLKPSAPAEGEEEEEEEPPPEKKQEPEKEDPEKVESKKRERASASGLFQDLNTEVAKLMRFKTYREMGGREYSGILVKIEEILANPFVREFIDEEFWVDHFANGIQFMGSDFRNNNKHPYGDSLINLAAKYGHWLLVNSLMAIARADPRKKAGPNQGNALHAACSHWYNTKTVKLLLDQDKYREELVQAEDKHGYKPFGRAIVEAKFKPESWQDEAPTELVSQFTEKYTSAEDRQALLNQMHRNNEEFKTAVKAKLKYHLPFNLDSEVSRRLVTSFEGLQESRVPKPPEHEWVEDLALILKWVHHNPTDEIKEQDKRRILALLDRPGVITFINEPIVEDGEYHETLINYAVAKNRPDLVKLLLDRGADPRVRSGKGLNNALHVACYQEMKDVDSGKLSEILKLLLRNESYNNDLLSTSNQVGLKPFGYILLGDKIKNTAYYLLRHVPVQTLMKNLHETLRYDDACWKHSEDKKRALMSWNQYISDLGKLVVGNPNQNLFTFIRSGNDALIDALMRDHHLFYTNRVAHVEREGIYEYPLHYAIRYDIEKPNFPCTEILISYGALPYLPNPSTGNTALHEAAMVLSSTDYIHLLLKLWNSPLLLDVTNKEGESALSLLFKDLGDARKNQVRTLRVSQVRELINAGAKLFTGPDNNGHYACKHILEMVEQLPWDGNYDFYKGLAEALVKEGTGLDKLINDLYGHALSSSALANDADLRLLQEILKYANERRVVVIIGEEELGQIEKRRGDSALVRKNLENKMEWTGKSPQFYKLIWDAAPVEDADSLDRELVAGADPNKLGYYMPTGLGGSVANLLKGKAKAKSTFTSKYEYPLHAAIKRGHFMYAELLQKAGAVPYLVDPDTGNTALHEAVTGVLSMDVRQGRVYYNFVDMIMNNMIVNKIQGNVGKILDVKNKEGETALSLLFSQLSTIESDSADAHLRIAQARRLIASGASLFTHQDSSGYPICKHIDSVVDWDSSGTDAFFYNDLANALVSEGLVVQEGYGINPCVQLIDHLWNLDKRTKGNLRALNLIGTVMKYLDLNNINLNINNRAAIVSKLKTVSPAAYKDLSEAPVAASSSSASTSAPMRYSKPRQPIPAVTKAEAPALEGESIVKPVAPPGPTFNVEAAIPTVVKAEAPPTEEDLEPPSLGASFQVEVPTEAEDSLPKEESPPQYIDNRVNAPAAPTTRPSGSDSDEEEGPEKIKKEKQPIKPQKG